MFCFPIPCTPPLGPMGWPLLSFALGLCAVPSSWGSKDSSCLVAWMWPGCRQLQLGLSHNQKLCWALGEAARSAPHSTPSHTQTLCIQGDRSLKEGLPPGPLNGAGQVKGTHSQKLKQRLAKAATLAILCKPWAVRRRMRVLLGSPFS